MAKTIELCKVYSFTTSSNLCQRTTCETQMLQIVTLRGGYLYRNVYLCIVNSTQGATWFINFVLLNILW